jgi:hypothetical protein
LRSSALESGRPRPRDERGARPTGPGAANPTRRYGGWHFASRR